MIINGTNLSTVGFEPGRGRQIPRMGGEQSDVFVIPGAIGGIRLAASVPPGRIVQPGWVKGTDHADLLANLEALTTLLQGEVAIRFPDIPGREWHGFLQAALTRSDPLGPDQITTKEAVTLEFLLPNPTATDVGSAVSWVQPAETTWTVIPLGNAPSHVLVDLTVTSGSLLSFQIVTSGDSGTTQHTFLQWDAGIGNDLVVGDQLLIGTDFPDNPFTVRTIRSAVEANEIDGLDATSEFPLLVPGQGIDEVWFQHAGAGATVDIGVRKRWW